jgi:hypothetical protein
VPPEEYARLSSELAAAEAEALRLESQIQDVVEKRKASV